MIRLMSDYGSSPWPLTELSEEEALFRDAVSDFARSEVRPLAAAMDRDGAFRPELLQQFFQLDLMGIEIPVSLGGAGASFFMSILAVEALSREDASAGVVVDVQNTLGMSRQVPVAQMMFTPDSLDTRSITRISRPRSMVVTSIIERSPSE